MGITQFYWMDDLRVLLVTKDPQKAIRLASFFEEHDLCHEFVLIHTQNEVKAALKPNNTIVICEYPTVDWLIDESRDSLNIPTILITDQEVESELLNALSIGAKDYIDVNNTLKLLFALKRELSSLSKQHEFSHNYQLLEEVFESQLGVRITDEEGRILKVNEAYCQMTGYKFDELLNTSIYELLPDDLAEVEKESYKKVLQAESQEWVKADAQRKFIRKDGSFFESIIHYKSLGCATQKFVITTLEDVSEIFKYKTLFEESGRIAKMAGWERDVVTKKEVWTDEMYSIYEVTKDEFDPAVDSDEVFLAPNSVPVAQKALSEAEEGIPFYIEVEIITHKGNQKWCRATGIPVFEGDKVVRLIGSFQDITERKNHVLELQKSEEKYKFLFEHSPIPMIVFNVDNDKIIGVNNASLEMYGYSEEEFKNMHSYDLRPQKDIEEYKRQMKRYVVEFDGTRYYQNITHLAKNGRKYTVDIHARYITIGDDKANIVLVTDVTQKHEYEKELLQTNKILNTLINSAPVGLMMVDREGVVNSFWNATAEKMFGWSKSEVMGNVLPYVPQEKKEEFQYNLAKLFSENKSQILEIERVRKNGSTIFLKEFVTPIEDEAGNIYSLMILSEDITEKKKVEQDLINSERKYRTLVEASHDLIWRIDGLGNFTFINNACTEILGYTPSDLIGKSFIPLIPDSIASETIDVHLNVMAGKSFDTFPLQMITKDGELRYLSGKAHPIYDNEGIVIGCLGTASDVTHLTNYQRQLEESIAEKDILIKEIHHRVKNNLAVISGLFVLQSMYTKDDRMLDILKESQSRIKSIATIHERLYQNDLFSSIEVKEYLEKLSGEINDTYRREDRNIKVEVIGDRITLNVNHAVPFGILANELIINAFKYAFTESGEGVISLHLSKEQDGNIVFEVCDNGKGLPDDFDIDQLNSLGMTLVKTLTDQLEGTFEWHSKEDLGTLFRIRFKPTEVASWVN